MHESNLALSLTNPWERTPSDSQLHEQPTVVIPAEIKRISVARAARKPTRRGRSASAAILADSGIFQPYRAF